MENVVSLTDYRYIGPIFVLLFTALCTIIVRVVDSPVLTTDNKERQGKEKKSKRKRGRKQLEPSVERNEVDKIETEAKAETGGECCHDEIEEVWREYTGSIKYVYTYRLIRKVVKHFNTSDNQKIEHIYE